MLCCAVGGGDAQGVGDGGAERRLRLDPGRQAERARANEAHHAERGAGSLRQARERRGASRGSSTCGGT